MFREFFTRSLSLQRMQSKSNWRWKLVDCVSVWRNKAESFSWYGCRGSNFASNFAAPGLNSKRSGRCRNQERIRIADNRFSSYGSVKSSRFKLIRTFTSALVRTVFQARLEPRKIRRQAKLKLWHRLRRYIEVSLVGFKNSKNLRLIWSRGKRRTMAKEFSNRESSMLWTDCIARGM